MSRLRVMLVDDQKLVLLGLERALRSMRALWEVESAESGRAAQERLEAEPFDVLVTDLNMPGFGGLELLAWTREHRPGTARIVLSGRQEPAMIQAAARSAHRFLTKPSEPRVVLEAIAQVSGLRTLPGPGEAGWVDLRGAVGGMGQLPGSPVACHRVKVFLNDPEAATATLQEPVTQDPGLAFRALQLVNSSYFGAPRATVDPWEAVQCLDRRELACFQADPAPPEAEARLRPIRDHHLRLARTALAITRSEGAPEAVRKLAYTSGLLAAAGPMILALAAPAGVPEGVERPELSRQYLSLAGLPGPLLDLVGNLRTPSLAGSGEAAQDGAFALALAAVHVAAGHRDETFLALAGFLDRLPTWHRLLPDRGSP